MKRQYQPPEADRLALRKRVNDIRDKLEASPMLVNGFWIDVNEKADKRMKEVVELAASAGITEQTWTLADNSEHLFAIGDFIALYNAMRLLRMQRAGQLHTEALRFKNKGFTQADLDNWQASYPAP